jgi:hypothetical protein
MRAACLPPFSRARLFSDAAPSRVRCSSAALQEVVLLDSLYADFDHFDAFVRANLPQYGNSSAQFRFANVYVSSLCVLGRLRIAHPRWSMCALASLFGAARCGFSVFLTACVPFSTADAVDFASLWLLICMLCAQTDHGGTDDNSRAMEARVQVIAPA